MSPLVSVIIPMWNAEQYIDAALTSILNQTLIDIECIVVDDKSTDNSLKVVRQKKDPRLFVIVKECNEGYPTAMNDGLRIARGKYIARMDADDVSSSDRLEKQLLFLESHPEMAFVGSWRYWIGKRKNIYPETRTSAAYIEENWTTLLQGTRKFTDASVLVRHEFIKQAGGYRTYQRSGQDVDLWLRILEKHLRAATLPEYFYGRRLIPSAITFSENTYLKNKIPRLLAKERVKNGTDCLMRGEPLNYPFSAQEIKDAKNWRIGMLWNTARNFYEFKEYSSANSFAKAAILAGGWHPQYAKLWGKCLLGIFKSKRWQTIPTSY